MKKGNWKPKENGVTKSLEAKTTVLFETPSTSPGKASRQFAPGSKDHRSGEKDGREGGAADGIVVSHLHTKPPRLID